MNRKKLSIICVIACIAIISISTLFILTNNKHAKEKVTSAKVKTEPLQTNKPITRNNSTVLEQNDLDFSFLKLNNNEENMVYSPLSIKYAFNMLRDGACSDTKEELDKMLGSKQLTTYDDIPNVLSLANSIFINDNVKDKINENYVTNIHDKYNAEVKYDSFKNAENINKWIEDKTMGTIKKMVKDENLVNAKYTLVNALAIDMEWQYDIFSEEECLFNYTDEQSAFVKSVDASVHNENILYSSNDDVISVTVPMKKYDNFQFEYIAIMPKNLPLKDYINAVTSNDINNIVDSQIPTSSDAEIDNVNITLPVYNYDYSLNLDDSLKALGIKTLYNHPDLSNISDIDIGEIRTLHKADISFSKKGTKAAASTAIIAIELCCEPIETNDIYLTFDKPYMYIIRDKDTHEIWFVGTVYEPETSK